MIHQFIFAAPKPGMSDREFQDYWVKSHAVKYASKIPQIKKYLVNTTTASQSNEVLPFRGVAEIWLNNEKEQLESLQTKEFLKGARLDEPNWAAFWLTMALDTDTHTILPAAPEAVENGIKLIVLTRRKEGMLLEQFRKYCKSVHASMVKDLPGLKKYEQCYARDALYTFGESRFDMVSQLWFENPAALEEAMNSRVYREHIQPDLHNFTELRYQFHIIVQENWIIGPAPRQ